MRPTIVWLVVLALLGCAGAGWAEDGAERVVKQGAYIAAAAAGSAVYTAIKIGLCAAGLGVSPLVFLSSGPTAARTVATRTCEGTWILTSDHLTGDKPLELVADTIPFPED